MPYFYLILHHKPIRDILQRLRVFGHCNIAHFLGNQVHGTCSNTHGSNSTALMHISRFLKWSGMYFSVYGLMRTASLHTSSVLRWSGIYFSVYGLMRTALLHISWVLRWSGTNSNECDSMCAASLHIPGYLDDQGSLFSSLEQSHTGAYLLCIFKPPTSITMPTKNE